MLLARSLEGEGIFFKRTFGGESLMFRGDFLVEAKAELVAISGNQTFSFVWKYKENSFVPFAIRNYRRQFVFQQVNIDVQNAKLIKE